MSIARTALCATLVVAVAAVAAQGQAVTPNEPASPWVDLHKAQVRLLAGPPAAKSAKSYLAGVEITLADGWKTYWRMPGDAGVPPTFDWTGSTNVAQLKVLYPAPSRLHEPGAETIGYTKSVLFPVEVLPADAAKPVDLKLAIEFGVCRDICIPAEAKLSLTLNPAGMAGAPAAAILAALERVPRQPASRRANDPRLERVTATLDGPSPRLLIEARFPADSASGDVFIEAPDGIYVPMPRRLVHTSDATDRVEAKAGDGLVRFVVDLARNDIAKDLEGKVLTLTLIGAAGASEAAWTVP
jgi:DsbC/DsbD-like thiol-disulfide interchange protein